MKKSMVLLIKKINLFMNPVVFIAGLILLSIGVYKIFPPAMFIADGAVLMMISIFGDEKAEK